MLQIGEKVAQIIESNRILQIARIKEQATQLLIDTLQTEILVLQEFVENFQMLSTTMGVEQKLHSEEQIKDIKEKMGEVTKLTNWYVNEREKQSDESTRIHNISVVLSTIMAKLNYLRSCIIKLKSQLSEYSMLELEFKLHISYCK